MLLRKIAPEKRAEFQRFSAAIGGFSLCIAILLDRFAEHIVTDFVSGMLYGLAVVFNIVALMLFGKSIRNHVKNEPNTTISEKH